MGLRKKIVRQITGENRHDHEHVHGEHCNHDHAPPKPPRQEKKSPPKDADSQ